MILLGNIHLPFRYRCPLLRWPGPKIDALLPSDHRTCDSPFFSPELLVSLLFLSIDPARLRPSRLLRWILASISSQHEQRHCPSDAMVENNGKVSCMASMHSSAQWCILSRFNRQLITSLVGLPLRRWLQVPGFFLATSQQWLSRQMMLDVFGLWFGSSTS